MNTQLNPALYRRALGTFCSGLTIVTGYDTGPIGFSCQSFSAISLDPPLIMISPGRSSRTWPRIREVGSCCINVLADDQAKLCRSFAVSGAEKFYGVDWRLSTWGSPEIAIEAVPSKGRTRAITAWRMSTSERQAYRV